MGTVDDTILIAVGECLPEDILPSEAETAKETDSAEHYPVYVTKVPFIEGHMALILELITQRPDIGIERWSYNVRSMTKEEWANKDKKYSRIRSSER